MGCVPTPSIRNGSQCSAWFATTSSGLNREQMMLVMPLMDRFLETAIRVMVSSNDPWHNWGKLPYPPQKPM